MFLFKKKKNDKELPENPTSESGVAGDIVFSSFDREVERNDKTKIKEYRKMRDTDGTVEALYNVVTRPILAATFGVKADPEDENEEQAEFVRKCLFSQPHRGGMETPFSLVLEQMLKSVMDGFEVFERVYKFDEKTGKITLKKLALRDATTVTLRTDEHGSYNGIRQQASFGGKIIDITLEANKTFLITYGKADDLLYGRSAFKAIHINWDKKRRIEYLDSIALQNSAVRPKYLQRIKDALVKNGGDDKERKKALRTLSQLGQLKSTALIPNGYEVNELEGGNDNGMHESIERQNSEMARAFLASFIMLGTQGRGSTGSYALSSDQSDLFMLSLKGVMNLIVDHINQYWIADLIDLNYPAGKRHYPEFYFDGFTDEMTDFIKNIFTKLIEKDKISDGVVKGIENAVVNRFEIEAEEDARNEPQSDKNAQDDKNINFDRKDPKNDENGDEDDDMNDDGSNPKPKGGGDGDNAGKFRRKLHECEEKVNWSSFEKQADKIALQFTEKATPLLESYIEEVAENPENEIELPVEYINVLTGMYKTAYNYGKMSASDEEGKPAPKTKDSEKAHTSRFVNFIVEKQTSDIRNLISEIKMNAPVPIEDEARLESPFSIKGLILTAGAKWILQAVNGTANSIFGHGANDGRNDAFVQFDKEEEAVYMWSALLENTCAVCEKLDGSVFSREELEKSPYQPGKVHRGDKCIVVRVTGKNKPKVTGLPEGIDKISHISDTPKKKLQAEGIVGKDETKANALRRETMSNVDNGETLDEVEDAIRGQAFETMAAFSADGKKLFEWTNEEPSSVQPPKEWHKYFTENNGAVITHNHPSSSSFSGTDLNTAATYNIPELRIASRKYDYSIKAPQGWPNAEEMMEYAESQGEMFKRQAEKLTRIGRLSKEEVFSWVIEKKVVSVANKYGLDYNKTRRKEK